MKPLVYLTGMPASGKTTTATALVEARPDAVVLEYSMLLSDWLTKKHGREVGHRELRQASSGIITKEDVQAVDEELLQRAAEARRSNPVVVVSHPATREPYGFRVLMFPQEQLRRLAPSAICMLICAPKTISDRVRENAEGRPTDTDFETTVHTNIQIAVATAYSATVGAPLYFVQTDDNAATAVQRLSSLLGDPATTSAHSLSHRPA